MKTFYRVWLMVALFLILLVAYTEAARADQAVVIGSFKYEITGSYEVFRGWEVDGPSRLVEGDELQEGDRYLVVATVCNTGEMPLEDVRVFGDVQGPWNAQDTLQPLECNTYRREGLAAGPQPVRYWGYALGRPVLDWVPDRPIRDLQHDMEIEVYWVPLPEEVPTVSSLGLMVFALSLGLAAVLVKPRVRA